MATESDVAANQVVIERLNPAVQQQLNLDSVKTRALGLYKAISRVLEEFDAIGRANAIPKWCAIQSRGKFPISIPQLYLKFSKGPI